MSDASARWPADRAWAWVRARPWLLGFNYVPSTAVNTVEFWQASSFDPKTIARELGWTAQIGLNACRVFLQYEVWRHDPEGLKSRIGEFLTMAGERGLSTMACLFDDCAFSKDLPFLGKQKDPVPGRMMTSWTASPGHARVADRACWPDLERYVKDIVGTFANDARVLLWDLYNEPGNEGQKMASLPLVESTFAWARAAGPSQPLSSGLWSFSDEFQPLNAALLANSDVATFHTYSDLPATRARIAELKSGGRPVICTEWMARWLDSRWETHLPMFLEEAVGCYAWGLVNGRTQTHIGWDSVRERNTRNEWFHDIFHADGTPYRPDEIALIRDCALTGRTRRDVPVE